MNEYEENVLKNKQITHQYVTYREKKKERAQMFNKQHGKLTKQYVPTQRLPLHVQMN